MRSAEFASPALRRNSRYPAPGVYRAIVQKLFLLVAIVSQLAGCASKPKSEARLYDGDAPTIRYAPSTAGGPQSVY